MLDISNFNVASDNSEEGPELPESALQKLEKITELLFEVLEENEGLEDLVLETHSLSFGIILMEMFGRETAEEIFNDTLDFIEENEDDIDDEDDE